MGAFPVGLLITNLPGLVLRLLGLETPLPYGIGNFPLYIASLKSLLDIALVIVSTFHLAEFKLIVLGLAPKSASIRSNALLNNSLASAT